jgi:hypothetical protein
MQSQTALPSQSYVWGVLAPRFEADLAEQKAKVLRLCGLYDAFGPPGDGFTGEREANETIIQLAGELLRTVGLEMEERIAISRTIGRRVGRPRDVMSRYLGPALLTLFLRYHDSAGRHSVLTSIDGKLAQIEAGPFFEFVKVAIEPLNQFLVSELHRSPLSAARLARYALEQRRRNLRTATRR